MNITNINQKKAGVVLSYTQKIVSIISSLIYTPVMLRLLGQSQHGLFSTVSTTLGWLGLLNLGFGSSYIRFFSRYKARGQNEKIASLNGMFIIIFSIMGITALGLGFLMSDNLAMFFDKGLTPDEYVIARIVAIIATIDIAASFPASVFSSILSANQRFVPGGIANIFQVVCTPLVSLPLLLLGYGSIGLILATTVVDIISYIWKALYCIKVLKVEFSFSSFEKGLLKEIAGFSIFIAINSIVGQLASSIDKWMITRYISTAAVSIYSIGCALYTYFNSFTGAIAGVFTPQIHLLANQQKSVKEINNELTALFVRLGRFQFMLEGLFFTGIVFFGKPFIGFWAGEGYEESYIIAVLLCAAHLIPISQNLAPTIQQAQNKHRIRTVVYFITTFINIVLTYYLCRPYGAIGATVATVVSVVVGTVFWNIYYHKSLGLNMFKYWGNIARVTVGIIPPVLLGIALQWLDLNSIWILGLGILGYVAVYTASVWFLSFNKYEKELVGGKVVAFVFRNKKQHP